MEAEEEGEGGEGLGEVAMGGQRVDGVYEVSRRRGWWI